MTAVHYFRLKNGDREMEEKLASMTGKEKSDFIQEALDFYLRYGDKINNIDEVSSGIREILSKLDAMKIVLSKSVIKEPNIKDGINKNEEILKRAFKNY